LRNVHIKLKYINIGNEVYQKKYNDNIINIAKNEIDLLRFIKHPNIIDIIDSHDESNEIILVTEHLQGGDIFQRIKTKSTYNESNARDLIYVLLIALKCCHDKNVVHRDIKPENLMLVNSDCDSHVKLINFGSGKLMSDNIDELLYDFDIGTRAYKAPEWIDEKGYGKPVDMWAVGVTAFILLGGYPPFVNPGGVNGTQIMDDHIRRAAFQFKEPFDNVSAEAKDLISRLICIDDSMRLTVEEALEHPWVTRASSELAARNLNKTLNIFKEVKAKKHWKVLKNSLKAKRGFELGLG
jgi:calcium/calmodulin-dependent protein kinase I